MSTVRYRRIRKQRQFVQVDNAVVQNGAISYRARGVLAYVMSLPDEAPLDSVSIANACSAEGRDAVRGAIKELERAGHYWQRKVRGGDGRVFTEIAYTEEATCPWDDAEVRPIRHLRPLPDQPPTAQPAPGNPSPADEATGAWESVPGPTPENPSPAEPSPAPEKPAPGFPAAGGPGVIEKDEDKDVGKTKETLFAASGVPEPPADTAPPKGGRSDAMAGFEEIWQRWPDRNGRRVGKAAAARRWHAMTESQRAQAREALPRYRRWLEASGTQAKDMHRWLGSERGTTYEDFGEDVETVAGTAPQTGRVRPGTMVFEKPTDPAERAATAAKFGIEVVDMGVRRG